MKGLSLRKRFIVLVLSGTIGVVGGSLLSNSGAQAAPNCINKECTDVISGGTTKKECRASTNNTKCPNSSGQCETVVC